MSHHSYRLIKALMGLYALLVISAMPAQAQSSVEMITKVERWFENITTLQAEFTQVSSDGGAATGTLYLRRPHQMRLQYDGEAKVALIVSQGWLHVDEGAAKQVNSYPIGATPFAPMLKEDIQLRSPDFTTNVTSDKGVISVSLSKETGESAGNLTLEFSEKPFQLRRWIIEDSVGVTTKVTLQNPQYGKSFNNFLFALPPYSSPQSDDN